MSSTYVDEEHTGNGRELTGFLASSSIEGVDCLSSDHALEP